VLDPHNYKTQWYRSWDMAQWYWLLEIYIWGCRNFLGPVYAHRNDRGHIAKPSLFLCKYKYLHPQPAISCVSVQINSWCQSQGCLSSLLMVLLIVCVRVSVVAVSGHACCMQPKPLKPWRLLIIYEQTDTWQNLNGGGMCSRYFRKMLSTSRL
jgi:hypothetical protein